MRRASLLAALTLLLVAVAHPAWGQSTGVPSFNAPYRAFLRHEFGGTLSFPSGGDVAAEAQYRFGQRTWDIGVQGGFLQPERANDDARILLGVTARQRVITHSEEFPLDGALLLGGGVQLFSNPDPPGSTLYLPLALSLGRRVDIEDSEVSIVPYAQPTLVLSANGDTELNFTLGLGVDVRLSRLFDVRASIGLGELEGFALSAVWIR